MKILIVTYSREVNPGTFLQAYGVQHFFSGLFPDAQIDLLKHKRQSFQTPQNGVIVKKDFDWFCGKIQAIPRRLKYEWSYFRRFHLTTKEFGLFDYNQAEYVEFTNQYDLIVVGSDTILVNLKKSGNYGLMWLIGVNTKKILFAASAAPASYEISETDYSVIRNSLSSFDYLGVRDSVTESLLKDRLKIDNKVVRMFDPTYCLPNDIFSLPLYCKLVLNWMKRRKKVVLVNFGDAFLFKKDLTNKLQTEGYYVVSTVYNKWADYNIMSLTPFQWGGLFKELDLIVTERFHDSVFSLRNTKPVIPVDWDPKRFSEGGFSKTKSLLENYEFNNLHHICKSAQDLDAIMGTVHNVESLFSEEQCKRVNVHIQEDYKKVHEKLKNIM